MPRPASISAPPLNQNLLVADAVTTLEFQIEGVIDDNAVTPFMTLMTVYNGEYGNVTIPVLPPLDATLVNVAFGTGSFTEAMNIYVGLVDNPAPNLIVIWAMWDFPDIDHPETWFEISFHAFTAEGTATFDTPITPLAIAATNSGAAAVVPTSIPPSKRIFALDPRTLESINREPGELPVTGSIRLHSRPTNRDPLVYIRAFPASQLEASPKLATPWTDESPDLRVARISPRTGTWRGTVPLPVTEEDEQMDRSEFLIVAWIQSPNEESGYFALTQRVTVIWRG